MLYFLMMACISGTEQDQVETVPFEVMRAEAEMERAKAEELKKKEQQKKEQQYQVKDDNGPRIEIPSEMPPPPLVEEMISTRIFAEQASMLMEQTSIWGYSVQLEEGERGFASLPPGTTRQFRQIVTRLVWSTPNDLMEQALGHEEGEYTYRRYDVPWRDEWRTVIIETVRIHLKDPENLWKVYRQIRPVAVGLVGDWEYAPQVSHYTKAVSYQLQLEPPDDLLLLYEMRPYDDTSNFGVTWERGEYYEAALDQGFDGWLIGWRQRRYAEGGDALVDAWAKILKDFANHLDAEIRAQR